MLSQFCEEKTAMGHSDRKAMKRGVHAQVDEREKICDCKRSGYLSTLERHTFSCREGASRVQKMAHWHNDIEVSLQVIGGATLLCHGSVVEVPPRSFSLFWGGMPHQTIAVTSDDARCYWLYIPLAWFLQWSLPEPFKNALLSGRRITESGSARFDLDAAMFQQWERDLNSGNAEDASLAAIEIQTRIRRLALKALSRQLADPPQAVKDLKGPISRLEAMVNFMASHYQERITLTQIAHRAGLHPNYASPFFRRASGITLQTFLKQLRISHAQRLLALTDDKVLDIGLTVGFNSLSRFYAAFKSSCGQSPNAYRKAIQSDETGG